MKSKCPHCQGTKVEQGEDVLNVIIEKGMPDGYEIVSKTIHDQTSQLEFHF
jgi:DnaJ-class molecular chaperone